MSTGSLLSPLVDDYERDYRAGIPHEILGRRYAPKTVTQFRQWSNDERRRRNLPLRGKGNVGPRAILIIRAESLARRVREEQAAKTNVAETAEQVAATLDALEDGSRICLTCGFEERPGEVSDIDWHDDMTCARCFSEGLE